MGLSNFQKADLLRYAIRSAPDIENGLYHFRLAMFEALEGCSLNADEYTDIFAPPGEPLGSGEWINVSNVPDMIEADPGTELKGLQLWKMLI